MFACTKIVAKEVIRKSYSGYILKVGETRCAERSEMRWEREGSRKTAKSG